MTNFVQNVETHFERLWITMRIQKSIITALFLIFFLSGCGNILAADITPPPSSVQPAPVSPEPATPVAIVLPLVMPDIQNGAAIFSDKCAPCHGDAGMGDGPQSTQLPNPVAPLGDYKIAETIKPIDWYRTITLGNFEKFMPAFQSLSDRDRWDVTAYALTLSLSRDMVDQGEKVFTTNCVECHTQEKLPLQNASAMAEKSLDDIQTIIVSGIGSQMHSFEDVLSKEEVASVASYVRFIGLSSNQKVLKEDNLPSDTENETPQNAQNSKEFTSFSIKGKLVNLESVPQNLVVALAVYDGMQMIDQLESPVSNDGTFEFTDLENAPSRIYQASIVIDGIQQNSEVIHNPEIDTNGNVALSIVIKKMSSDTSALFAERMHVFFDFLDSGTIQIVEMFVIQNPTDVVIVPKDESSPLVKFVLPPEAQNLQFERGILGREFIQTDNGFGTMQAIDANSSSQILFGYELPYSKSLNLDFQLPLPVNASIFMVPSNSVKFESGQLTYTGERDVQGMKIQTYSGNAMEALSSISVSLSGKIKENKADSQNNNTTSIIIGSVGLLLAIGFAIFYFKGKLGKNKEISEIETNEEDLESLLDAVIALDDAFQSGEIPEIAYLNRRNELTALIKSKQNSEE